MKHAFLLPVSLLLLLVFAAVQIGCVQRTISITSKPSGALVRLNDQEVGRTPLTVPFKYYGTYQVQLQRRGYQPLLTQAQAVAPWWEWPGPDLVAEAVPEGKSEVVWHFEMQPQVVVDEDAMLQRARDLQRAASQTGPVQMPPIVSAASDQASGAERAAEATRAVETTESSQLGEPR